MRTILRGAAVGFLAGAIGLSTAWAGASLVEPPSLGDLTSDPTGVVTDTVDQTRSLLDRRAEPQDEDAAAATTTPVASSGERLPDGWFEAGTAVRSLVPPDDRWVRGAECSGIEQLYTPLTPDGCLITFDMLWASGYDAQNPIEVRAVAIGNGEETVVFATLDLVGYMAAYPSDVCADCGIDQITSRLGAELGIPQANFVIASSHTHAAPSTIAAGPSWYYEHIRDQIIATITEATSAMTPVRLETGAIAAKPWNTDRRIVNRAVPDYELTWLRAYAPREHDRDGRAPERTVATIGNFAAHPTVTASNAVLHSGFVGPFNRRLEQHFGGTGLWFAGGLGDQRVDRGFGVDGLGFGLADLIIEDQQRGGYVLETNDIAVARTEVQIPVENQFFLGALAVGYAVRDFTPPYGGGPVVVPVQNSGAVRPICVGVGALHVVGPVSGIRLGRAGIPGKPIVGGVPTADRGDSVVFMQAPGEIFSAISLITKDYLSKSRNVFVNAFANDTLGYMTLANQHDVTAMQGLGLLHNALNTGNYEEALSLGHCTGEIVLNAMLEVGRDLGVMGEGEGP